MLYSFSRNPITDVWVGSFSDASFEHRTALYLFPSDQPMVFGVKPPERRNGLYNNIINPFYMGEEFAFTFVFMTDVLTYLQYHFVYEPNETKEQNVDRMVKMGIEHSVSRNFTGHGASELVAMMLGKAKIDGEEWGEAFSRLNRSFPELGIDQVMHLFKPRFSLIADHSGLKFKIFERYYITPDGRKTLNPKALNRPNRQNDSQRPHTSRNKDRNGDYRSTQK